MKADPSGGAYSAQVTEVLPELKLPLPEIAEIYRYLGYTNSSAPAVRVAQEIEHVVKQSQSVLSAKGAYSIYSVAERTAQSIAFGDAVVVGDIGDFLEGSQRIAVFVVTAGAKISELSKDAGRKGDVLAALVMDAVGSWGAETAGDALMTSIGGHAAEGESLTLRYSPGYCGMGIGQQRTLFQMVQADAIGVKLLPSLLMYPLKSISGVVGLGPRNAVKVHESPCDHCLHMGCHMRR